MKKNIYALILLMFAAQVSWAQFKFNPKGDKNKSKRITLKEHSAVKIEGDLKVQLKQTRMDQTDHVIISAGSQDLDAIRLGVIDGVLYISQLRKFKGSITPLIILSSRSIHQLELKGKMDVSAHGLISCDTAYFHFIGGVNASFTNFNARHISMNLGGTTSVEMRGFSKSQDLKLHAEAKYDGQEFKTTVTSVKATASSTAKVNCKREITGTLSGNSSLTYVDYAKVKPQLAITGEAYCGVIDERE